MELSKTFYVQENIGIPNILLCSCSKKEVRLYVLDLANPPTGFQGRDCLTW